MAAAADTIGTFGVDNNFGTAGNWSAGVPTVGQDARISGTAQDISAGLTPALTGANKLSSFRVAASYTGNIGATGGSNLTLDATDLDFFGGGPTAFFSGDFTNVHSVHSSRGTSALVLNVRSAGITNVYSSRGRTGCASGAFSNVNVTGNGVSDATLDVNAGATITTLSQANGMVNYNSTDTYTTANIGGGEITVAAGTITTTNISGGRVRYNDGTMTTIHIRGGVLDCTKGNQDRTITDLHLYDGGTVDLRGGAGAVTVTNWHVHGGTILGIQPQTLALT